jgi:O-antigen ligase
MHLPKKNIIHFVCGLSLILSYLCPYHIHPFRSYYNDVVMIVGLLLAILAFLVEGQKRFNLSKLALLPLMLIVVIAVQTVFIPHQDFFDLLFPCLYLLMASVAIVLGATFSCDDEQRAVFARTLASALLIAGLISVVMQLMQSFSLNAGSLVMYMANEGSFARPYANIAQPNQLALILCFSMAANYYLFQAQLIHTKVAVAGCIFLLLGLVLTQSRIGWIIVPAFALTLWRRSPETFPVSRIALFMLPALYFLMVFALPFVVAAFGVSGASLVEHVGGRSERSVLWQQAWHMAATHPWLGVGWFGFGPEQVRIAADFGSSTYAEHAHNIILNFAAEMGWPVTLIFFGTLAWWFAQACIFTRQTAVTRFASLCLIAAAVHSMVEFPMWYAYILLPVALLMGMLHQQRWPSTGVVVSPQLVAPAILSALVLIGIMTWDYQRVVAGFNVLRASASDTVAGKKALRQPQYTFYPEFYQYFQLMQIKPEEGMSAQDIRYVEQWTPRFGFVHILNKLAEVDVLNGKPKQAARAMQTLQRLHPDAYPEYFDYWQAKAALDSRYKAVFALMPPRDSP